MNAWDYIRYVEGKQQGCSGNAAKPTRGEAGTQASGRAVAGKQQQQMRRGKAAGTQQKRQGVQQKPSRISAGIQHKANQGRTSGVVAGTKKTKEGPKKHTMQGSSRITPRFLAVAVASRYAKTESNRNSATAAPSTQQKQQQGAHQERSRKSAGL